MNDQARRARLLEGRSGCGLCGVDTLTAAMRRPFIRQGNAPPPEIADAALLRAFTDLAVNQPLNQVTRSVHGAAWCNLSGEIVCVVPKSKGLPWTPKELQKLGTKYVVSVERA